MKRATPAPQGEGFIIGNDYIKTARIYKFYESGIMDSYIGSLKDEPLTGSYELDNDKIYMSYFERSNPKENDKTPFTVVSYDENEIIVTAMGKTITWKRYE